MSKYLTAYYIDEEDLLKGIGLMKARGVQIADVLTPFPVHGIDKALGFRRSRLTRVAFIGGAFGAVMGFAFQAWVFTIGYPINFGGKPFFAVPSFIPVTFEMTVLFASFSMVIAFLVNNRLGPGAKPVIHDERATDDRFLVVVSLNEDSTPDQILQVEQALAEAGAEGITLKV